MDPKHLILLRDNIVTEFADPDRLQSWVATHILNENVHNILVVGDLLNEQAFALLKWAQARSRLDEILQMLADDPPFGSRRLPDLIYFVSNGAIQPVAARRNGIPPVTPTEDWFVTRRPFANRTDLRRLLDALGQAAPGPDSVLVIDGDRFSGKSHGIRFAIQCAPQDRFTPIDVADFGTVVMNAMDLTMAIDNGRNSEFPAFDPTKEDEAVPRLLFWLTGKLKGSQQWIIIDHCSRANLSQPAGTLLTKLTGVIERGALPGVRMVIADIDRSKLPGALAWSNNYDRAVLPDQTAVENWCQTLGAHIGKALTPLQIAGYRNAVFNGITPATTPEQRALLLETGLSKVFGEMRAL
jgi:hypothetical protein